VVHTLGQDLRSTRGNKPEGRVKPSEQAERIAATPSVETLRAKMDAAIVAEEWEAVKAIRQRIVEVEREAAGNVVAIRR
jgi:protein-arginine kinase activator protein McsA